MMKMYVKCMSMLNGLRQNKKGQGLVEYGLIVGLIAVVVVGAVTLLGTRINTFFTNIVAALTPAP